MRWHTEERDGVSHIEKSNMTVLRSTRLLNPHHKSSQTLLAESRTPQTQLIRQNKFAGSGWAARRLLFTLKRNEMNGKWNGKRSSTREVKRMRYTFLIKLQSERARATFPRSWKRIRGRIESGCVFACEYIHNKQFALLTAASPLLFPSFNVRTVDTSEERRSPPRLWRPLWSILS